MANQFGLDAVKTLTKDLNTRLEFLEEVPVDEDMTYEGDIAALLKIAMKNEIEASEIAAFWMPTTPEINIKIGFARQVGDEARHYLLIWEYLFKQGADLRGFNPVELGYSALFMTMQQMQSTIERLAAAQFTREAIALRRNETLIDYLDLNGHGDIASIYRDQIQPDEQHHHDLGRRGLEDLIESEEDLAKARAAMERTLTVADELKQAARKTTGSLIIPGC